MPATKSPKTPAVKPSLKQRKAFEESLKNGGNVSAAMEVAEYAPATIHNPQNLTNSLGWQALMEQHIPDSLLAIHHKKLLTTRRLEHLSFPLGPALESDIEIPDEEAGGDDMFAEAVNAVREAGSASTSHLQRKLRIGYSRAARLMDMLEEAGVIGEADGSRPREVLDYDPDEEVEQPEGVEVEMEPQPHGGSLMRKHAYAERITLTNEDILKMFTEEGIRVSHITSTRTERLVYYWAHDTRAIKDALDLAYKIKGKMSPEQTPPPAGPTYNIFTNPTIIGQVNAFEAGLKEQLTHAKPTQESTNN